jgi:hypothetical protein
VSDADLKGGTGLWRGRYLRLLLLLVTLVGLNYAGAWLAQQFDVALSARQETLFLIAVVLAVGLYVLLMAMPFMPGIEIGLVLMLMLGTEGCVLVYLGTLAALSISFAVGRKVPLGVVGRLFNWLRLRKAGGFINRLEPLSPKQRLDLLYREAPARVVPYLLKYRYLAIAVALNLPGNGLIGGGGGIGLIIGMSRIIPYPAYLLLLSICIAPVPLILFLKDF